MRDPHYGGMCFKSVKTLGAWAFSTAKNVDLLGLYPIHNTTILVLSGLRDTI